MTPIEKEIEGIVDGILEDYRHGRDIDKLDPFQHPDKAVVIDMIGKLLRIVYPAPPGTKPTASTTPSTTSPCSLRT